MVKLIGEFPCSHLTETEDCNFYSNTEINLIYKIRHYVTDVKLDLGMLYFLIQCSKLEFNVYIHLNECLIGHYIKYDSMRHI